MLVFLFKKISFFSTIEKMERNFGLGIFFTQNQISQINIGTGPVLYRIKAFSIVIRTTLERFKKCPNVEKNRLERF